MTELLRMPAPRGPLSGPHADPDTFDVPVLLDPTVEYGWTDSYPATIRLAELNERVLLHEWLHVLVLADPASTVPTEAQEGLVRYLTRGILLGGYRRTEDRADLPCPMGPR